MASHSRDLEILLVGKTGNGKSATGNSITLKKSFESKNKMEAVTKRTQVEYSEFEGRKLKVVDTPGVGDANMGEAKTFDHFKEAKESMRANPHGSVILIIVKYGNRFGEENVQAVQQLNQIFGKDFIESRAIIVFTCGDKFEEEDFVMETKMTFEDWVKEQSNNTAFKTLIQDCGYRFLLFDNRTKENAKQLKQLRLLIETIDNLNVDNKMGTKEQFNKTDQLSEDMQGTQLREEVNIKTSLMTERLSQLNGDISRYNPEQALDELQKMSKDTADLYQTIVEHHNAKGGLSVETEALSRLQDDIRKQIQLLSQMNLNLQKEAKEKVLKKLKLEKEGHEAKKKNQQALENERREKERLHQIEVQKREDAERQKRLAENEDLKHQKNKHVWTEDVLRRAEEEKRKVELKQLEEDRKILENERKQLENEKELIVLQEQLTAKKAAEIHQMKEKEEGRRREKELLEEGERLLRQKREQLRQKEERYRMEQEERRVAEKREQEENEARKRRHEEEWRRKQKQEEELRRKEEELRRAERERQIRQFRCRVYTLLTVCGIIVLVASVAYRKHAADTIIE